MSSGERPIGTAKGKQPNTEALCQTPRNPCLPVAVQQNLPLCVTVDTRLPGIRSPPDARAILHRRPPNAIPPSAGGCRMRLLWSLWTCIGCTALSRT